MTSAINNPANGSARGNFQLPMARTDVCLVCMPFHKPAIPSLALGLLQAVLAEGGIKAVSVYANLLFCEELGLYLYQRNQIGDPRLPMAEWTFASAAFPDFQPDDSRIISEIHAMPGVKGRQTLEECRKELRFIRESAEAFTARLAEQILKLSPRIVGCTSSIHQRVPSLALLRKIQELNPAVITLMGGAECETVMGRATHRYFPWVDFVVSGEGEDLILGLVRLIFEFGRQIPPEVLPEGVFAPLHRRSGYPGAGHNGDRLPQAVATSFDRQLIPAYQDYFDTLNSLPVLGKVVRPGLPVQSSRGCWYGKCKFCGLNAPQVPYRSRPAAGVLAELDELNRRYGVEHFEFLDNVLDMKYFDSLIPELIRRGAPYRLFYEIRSNLSKKHLKMLREAGITWCQPGIESLHSDALKALTKGVTAWQNIQALKWCRQFGIRTHWILLYDFPGDQDSWYQEMADLAPLLTHLSPPMWMERIQYVRNSHYFEQAAEYSLDLTTLPLDPLIYPLSTEAISELSDTFDDKLSASVKDPGLAFLFDPPGLKNLKSAVTRWFLEFISEKHPMLSMTAGKKEIVVHDTRPIAVAPSFRLNGIQRELYLACDRAVAETQLRAMLLDKGYDSADINAAIQTLLDNKLLVRIDRRLLALAIEEPYYEYIPDEQSPMGCISSGQTVSVSILSNR